MRQKDQTPRDNQLRSALENMRYKACTPENISFLRSLISSNLPGRSSVCDEEFRNVSIITARNLHKDEINRLGALRFAQETGQTLVDFYSEDSCNVNSKDTESKHTTRLREITGEVQSSLWSQPPSCNNKNIAGKLSLCIGLPVMIRNNYATELCMTRGQEGFVFGWQSKVGKQGQTVLDTLFIKLKKPPSIVKFNGLPENVIPIYSTSNNIIAQLPDDRKVLISRTQLEVLVNFAMTDFASQGKTRPENVADLNNLQTHQAYYTALSRSSTAKGTLILQGFDSKKITGGCSGALRQEFRELEILDEITTLRYNGKLSVNVHGDIRNILIKTFRKSKGEQYVPKLVHSAIRWSKRDPLNESEIIDIKSINLDKFNKKRKFVDDTSNSTFSAKKSSKAEIEDKKPALKKLCSTQMPVQNGNHYINPQGFIWSNNSCAYDATFTVFFNLWCSNKDLWTDELQAIGNPFILDLVNGFIDIDHNLKSFEIVRDDLRRKLEIFFPDNLQFGHFAALDDLFEVMVGTDAPVRSTSYACNNNHIRRLNNLSNYLVLAGTVQYLSTSSWALMTNEASNYICHRCGYEVFIKREFLVLPSVLAFDFCGHKINIDHEIQIPYNGMLHKFRLAGIIYFGQAHFCAQIILPDGQIWYHDGITTGRNMIYQGSMTNNPPDLSTCNNKVAVLAFYVMK
ncbi:hypothetical protein GALMADRAFT_74602 [Galerina marginata CBS 339.88]|uniref:DNA helicase n=1 Tax=Galerina marginata (strain CBS 339.88) TaxID=685588 RepID=A0A067SVE2_GALM3|nr:hypothetical protein GALMADRAFT_74602 [Galerina marginata CBS 339.88]